MAREDEVRRIVIVGGGTAGWLTAGMLAADHCAYDPGGFEITLVESPRIGILGVGEGTWPSMRDTLRRIGVSETEFFRRCNASFKQGTRFDGWATGADDDVYFHPFEAPPSADEVDLLALWRTSGDERSFAEAVGAQASICLAGKGPKQPATPEFAAVANYAYHLDAPAFADFLKEHCTDKLGVRHISDDLVSIERDDEGFVAAISTEAAGEISGDLFVDCTGVRALLIGEEFGAELTDVSDVLFNDRALAVQVPYATEDAPIAPQTTATATNVGWIWDIALQTRRGVGHVYSSRHGDEAEARAALGAYVKRTAPEAQVSSEDARLISFRSGYRKAPWSHNVVAIGMSSGFVEPLEASAIVMIELAAAMLSDTLPPARSAMPAAAERFNDRFAYRWERIVDFLKLHYVLSQRTEPYWADHSDRATWTPRLAALLDNWRHEAPSREDFPQAREIFTAASYAFVLYGMGFEPPAGATPRRTAGEERIVAARRKIDRARERCLAGLPDNRALVAHAMRAGFGVQ